MPHKKDITGQKFGSLTVLGDSGKRQANKKILWHCKCDCGNEIDISKDRLLKDVVPSCGCKSRKKYMYIGYRYGKLTVTKDLGLNQEHKRIWECTCDCGNIVVHSTSELNYGKTKSCGCLVHESGEKRKKYNARDRKLYYRWSSIYERCYNPNNHAYNNYGGRGIEMCPEWKKNFYAFRDWAINNGYNKSLSIDRIDNDKGYSPDNCRWTNNKQQCNNRRSNHYVLIDGITKTMTEWAEYYGIKYSTIQGRLARGWTDKDAVSKPVRPKKPTGEGARYKKTH